MTGLRPIVEVMFVDLLGCCYDQIMNQAAKMHYMMGGQLDLPLTIRIPYGTRGDGRRTYGGGAAAQHSQTLYSVLAHIPGLKVVVPTTAYNAKGLTIAAIRDNGPVIVLEHKFLGTAAKGPVPEESYTVRIGRAEVVRGGRDVTLCGIGRMTHVCLEAASSLAADGIDAEVVDVLTLAPLDENTILESVTKTRRLIVVDEDTPTASMARDIAARMADKAFDWLDAPIKTVTAPDTPVPFAAVLEAHYVPRSRPGHRRGQSVAWKGDRVVPRPIVVPSMSMYATEVTLVAWLRHAGTTVKAGEPVAEISTEKATFELEAPVAGILHPIAEVGVDLPVEAVMGYILADGEDPPETTEREPRPGTHRTDGLPASGESKGSQPANSAIAQRAAPISSPREIRASPIARRLAAQHGIDLARILGSGPAGRIVEADILAAVASGPQTLAGNAAGETRRVLRRVPFAGMRRTVADRLCASLATAASTTITREVHADVLVAARSRLSERIRSALPYDALFVKLLAAALRAHPELNATIENGEILIFDEINVGFAVSVEGGLLVPVIRNADTEPLASVAAAVRTLGERARAGQLRSGDPVAGTATISNLGAHGVDAFTPILNPPQSVILGIGRIASRPIVRDGQVAAGWTCTLSLTFDHRVADGAPAAQLLDTIARRILDEQYLMALA